ARDRDVLRERLERRPLEAHVVGARGQALERVRAGLVRDRGLLAAGERGRAQRGDAGWHRLLARGVERDARESAGAPRRRRGGAGGVVGEELDVGGEALAAFERDVLRERLER